MYSKEAFEAMTVVDLRQIARENGVKLSAGISKQGIVERLCDALVKEEEAPAPSLALNQPSKLEVSMKGRKTMMGRKIAFQPCRIAFLKLGISSFLIGSTL